MKQIQHVARSRRQLGRNVNMEVLQQTDKVPAPSGSHRRRTERILQRQVPPDDPRHKLTQRRITIRVRRTRNRNQRSKFRIAEPRKRAGDTSHDKAQHHRRPGMDRRRLTRQHKNSRADDRPDSKRNQIQRTESSFQSALALVLRLFQQPRERFYCQQLCHRIKFSTFSKPETLTTPAAFELTSASRPGKQEYPAERSSGQARCTEVCTAIVLHKSRPPSRYTTPATQDTRTPGTAAPPPGASSAAQTTP